MDRLIAFVVCTIIFHAKKEGGVIARPDGGRPWALPFALNEIVLIGGPGMDTKRSAASAQQTGCLRRALCGMAHCGCCVLL